MLGDPNDIEVYLFLHYSNVFLFICVCHNDVFEFQSLILKSILNYWKVFCVFVLLAVVQEYRSIIED